MDKMHMIKQIKMHVAEGETEAALLLFFELLKNSVYENKVIQLQSRFKHLKIQNIKGVMDSREIVLETNKINDSILDLCTILNQEGLGKADDINKTESSVQHTGIYIDPRDNKIYKTIKVEQKIWLGENLKFDSGEGCRFYKDDPSYEKELGRLYTWRSAMYACPPGWRIPNEIEWRNLMISAGGYGDGGTLFGAIVSPTSIGNPKKAYDNFANGKFKDFNIMLGGYKDLAGMFSDLGYYGRYWSSTESGTNSAWYYEFYKNGTSIYRKRGGKSFHFSCRCVWEG